MKNLITVFFAASACCCLGQVSNNAIQNRIRLSLDDPWFSSSTRNANVEWDCINKVLTSTCLVYHNDQWFTLIPPATGTYYINIANQRCANQQGVQIVVLEGDPCKVESYQLKMCISYTDQSDMFVQIDSLIGGKEYLLNIDGYLGDQCEFEIQFSTSNRGIPVQARNMKAVELRIDPSDTIVSLQWNIPDSLIFRIASVSLYRKHEKQKAAARIYSAPLARNAYGKTINIYSTQDTVWQKGRYAYSVYGHTVDGGVLMLAREEFLFRSRDRGSGPRYRATIDFVSPRSGHVNVNIFDESVEKQLFSTTRRIQKGKNKLVLDLSDYVDEGVTAYRIVIFDKTFRQEHYYRVRRRN